MAPIEVGTRKQLFIDERFIAASRGIELRMNLPVQHPEPVLFADKPWEALGIGAYNTVFREKDGRWRMWYDAMMLTGLPSEGARRLGYAESEDGIHWRKPGPGPDRVPGQQEQQPRRPARGESEHAGGDGVPGRGRPGRGALQAVEQVPPQRRRADRRRRRRPVGHALRRRHPLAVLPRPAEPSRNDVRHPEHVLPGRPPRALRRLHPGEGDAARRGGCQGRIRPLPQRRPHHLARLQALVAAGDRLRGGRAGPRHAGALPARRPAAQHRFLHLVRHEVRAGAGRLPDVPVGVLPLGGGGLPGDHGRAAADQPRRH